MTNAGIYIHIPFCRSRCSYCDFATGMYEEGLAQRYVRALANEITMWNEVKAPCAVDTIYFGGGTPSLLAPRQIAQILEAVQARFRVEPGAEVTMEMNPDELPLETLREFHGLGINRASFGAQSFDDRELKQLGRTHTSQDIPITFCELGEAGFKNINFDLIAGLPGQTLKTWERNLDRALRLRPEHLSLYLLDLHEGTPLADQVKRGMRPGPDNDLAAKMYRLMIEKVCAAGYEHYEISNFCLPGFESRHNTKYWTGDPYYGFGCSSHSYDGNLQRWANERDPSRYTEQTENGQSPIVERTDLSEDDARSESVFLALRLMRGVNLEDYRMRFGRDLRDQFAADLDRLSDAGLIEINEPMLKLTTRGVLLSNEVFATFV